MKHSPLNRVLLPVLLTAIAVFSLSRAQADLVYYAPFDDGANPSLSNLGTAGGNLTTYSGSPTSSTSTPTGLGSSHSEVLSVSSKLELPGSTTQFRLDTTGQQMTLSTWMYIDRSAPDFGWFSFFGNSSGVTGSGSGGWYLSVMGNAGSYGKVRLEASGVGNFATTSPVPKQEWFNVTVAYTVAGTANIYLNGTSIGSNYGLAANTNANPLVLAADDFNSDPARFDDLAIWNTRLSDAKIRSITTAPTALVALNDYNAGVMNNLFSLYDAGTGSLTVDSLTWGYASGFDVTGHALGDTWTSGGNTYIWLAGDSGSATGLSAVPEPGALSYLFGVGAFVLLSRLRRRAPSR
jgi:hypothetical protein